MNRISIAGETYSEILWQKFNLHYTSSCPLFKYYMYTSRSYWEEDKDFTTEQVRSKALKKCNNVLTSGRWSNKYPKGAQILAIVGVDQNLSDDSTGIQLRDIHPTSGTSHTGCWKIQKEDCKTKPRMEINIGGESNTSLVKSSGSATIHKIAGSGPVIHQSVEEALSHKVSETSTISCASLRTSRLDLCPPSTKVMSKPFCPSST